MATRKTYRERYESRIRKLGAKGAEFYIVDGKGHSWGSFKTRKEILDFFDAEDVREAEFYARLEAVRREAEL